MHNVGAEEEETFSDITNQEGTWDDLFPEDHRVLAFAVVTVLIDGLLWDLLHPHRMSTSPGNRRTRGYLAAR